LSIHMTKQGMTIAQAALEMGVSTRTVRRYIKAGKIQAELVEGPFGGEYRIYQIPNKKTEILQKNTIDNSSGQLPPDSGGTGQSQNMIQMMDYIKELQEKNLALAAQFGAASERVNNLENQIKLLGDGKKPWWQQLFTRSK
jgi:MerR family copper efflux transcriptional regulator